jgi:uncharacterized protein YndB with AHSA1/START domain
MTKQDFTTTFTVDQSPNEVFKAINNVRGWWEGEIEGSTDHLGAVFTYRFEDFHRSTHKITEFVPGKKVVWHTTDASINFVKDKTNGTAPTSSSKSPGRATRPSFASRISVWFQRSSATAAVREPGVRTSTRAFAA